MGSVSFQSLSNGSQNSPQSGEIKRLPDAKFRAALQAIFFQFEVIQPEQVEAGAFAWRVSFSTDPMDGPFPCPAPDPGALHFYQFSRSQSFSRLSWSPLAMSS